MNGLSQKLYLEMTPPDETDARDAARRILDALPQNLESPTIDLPVLRKLYPLCEEANWCVTATLAWNGAGWGVVDVVPGDDRDRHVGLAVDLGSTSITMQVVDMDSGRTLAGRSAINRQVAHGDEILSRIFYAHGHPERIEEMRRLTI